MIQQTVYGEVTRIDSARSIFGRGFYRTTAYLVDGLLVDTGCAHTAGELLWALQGTPIDRILNTHSHEDHIGANGLLQARFPGLEIRAHPLALPVLENPRTGQPLQLYRRLFWGWPEPSHGRLLKDGDRLETEKHAFQVIHTPGHSLDHICLYEPEQGWLFSGDLFIGGRDRALRVDADIWGIIASLKRVAALPLTILFPGSARVRENPGQAMIEKINYLEETGGKVLELHRQGQSVDLIARSLFGGPIWIEFITAGHFTRSGLVRSYLSGGSQ